MENILLLTDEDFFFVVLIRLVLFDSRNIYISWKRDKNGGFDNGDCMWVNEDLQKDYPGCVVQKITSIGNGIYNEGNYYVKSCSFDGGDYFPRMKLVGGVYEGDFL